MKKPHTFHIPVMGIGFTLDSPIKVSQYGIDSVVSLVDDILIEKFREMYSKKYDFSYSKITQEMADFRAKRITSYLDLMQDIAEKKLEEIKSAAQEKSSKLKKYFDLLPDTSSIKEKFSSFKEKYFNTDEIEKWLNENLSLGSIDVNIMTKIDKENYKNNEKLPSEYNDGHAAIRGFAQSKLNSSLILSAGMNPRLYNYMQEFKDFYPNENGFIKKKIALKVSDYRSALIQGKFLAKKGLWVSEFRIESGLNCGGHAFAKDGQLMGLVLEKFKEKRDYLHDYLYEILEKALSKKDKIIPPKEALKQIVTAQGGVGTHEEHDFLLDYYKVDSVGWGSPFLLVPEATSVDVETISKLEKATENDLYLSNISPMGIPFNNLRGNTKDQEKNHLAEIGTPGSTCPKKYVTLNTEFDDKGICAASRSYQMRKIKDLKTQNLSDEEYQRQYKKVIEKGCICVGLGTSSLIANNIDHKVEGDNVSVCPGPNMAYFNKIMSLEQISKHIYGKTTEFFNSDRPNFLVKEVSVYLDFLNSKIEDFKTEFSKKEKKSLLNFSENLEEGISYYKELFNEKTNYFKENFNCIMESLNQNNQILQNLKEKIRITT